MSLEVDRRTKGGSYVLKEMDGTILRQGVAAFRLYPYIERGSTKLDSLHNDNFTDNSDSDTDFTIED